MYSEPFCRSLCKINYRNQAYKLHILDALSYFENTTNLQKQEVTSFPVRVCFCRNNKPDCNHQLHPIRVRRGESFKITVVAVDQVNHTMSNSTIHTSITVPLQATLGVGQEIQLTEEGCTELKYSVHSSHDSEHLSMYAQGPCRDIGVSNTSIRIELLDCPIGFKENEEAGSCECYPALSDYVTDCSIDSESVLRRSDVWITFDNTTEQEGFVTYSNCPFDYCRSQDTPINLNEPNGADAQCAYNRSGRLCGSCENGLSLTLGSSHCKDCSSANSRLSLLIPFAVAGVVLVAFLLVCNLTVAIGTLNGLIFYANIIAANRAIFFPPLDGTNILTVFIAWLNLDFGFETCFYDGMDGYTKIWLQFVFPLYIIFLVDMVIIICEYSPRFSKLLSSLTLDSTAMIVRRSFA